MARPFDATVKRYEVCDRDRKQQCRFVSKTPFYSSTLAGLFGEQSLEHVHTETGSRCIIPFPIPIPSIKALMIIHIRLSVVSIRDMTPATDTFFSPFKAVGERVPSIIRGKWDRQEV